MGERLVKRIKRLSTSLEFGEPFVRFLGSAEPITEKKAKP